MSILKRTLRFIPILTILFLSLGLGRVITNIKHPKGKKGQNPGFFAQWFAEKKSADGTIPKWMYANWAAADKANLLRRGSSHVFDTVIELGPNATGGRTRSAWIDPRNENIILAGSVSGGMWRSENGGTTWVPLNDHEASLSVTSITSNPFNPNIIYYSTGESRGNSADVSGNGIYKSTDGGKTFAVLSSTVKKTGFDVIWKIAHSLTDSNTLYAGTDAQGLFRSIDAGNTWQQVYSGGNRQVTEILPLPNDRVIITMQGSVIVASDSAGKPGTFTSVTFPTPPGSGQYRRIQLASCKKFPNVCFALFEGNAPSYTDTPARFYKSSNGGRNWSRMASPKSIGSGQQGYNVMIGANPNDSNFVVTGGVNIAQTSNGGKTWSSKINGHSDHHGFVGFTTNSADFLVCTDGGIYKYKWSSPSVQASLNTGYKVTQFYAGNFGPTGFASISGTQDNGTHVATGKLTSKQFYGADGAYCHIGLQDGAVAYFSTQNEGIRRILDFNPSVKPPFSEAINDNAFTTEGVDFINAYTMNPGDQTQLYYRTNKSVYRSNDMGDSWLQIAKNRSGIKALACSNESNPVFYFGGTAVQLYKIESAATVNTTGNEVNYNSTVPSNITDDNLKSITVHPKDKYTIFLALNNYSLQPRIWKVSRMDSTRPVYKNVSGNLPAGLPVNSVAVDPAFPDKNLFAATDFGLYFTTDSGKTWEKEYRIPNVAVFEIKMREDRSLFAYTHGRGMFYLGLAGGNALQTKKSRLQSTVRLYPNPSKELISITMPEGLTVMNYSMFDLKGNVVKKGTITSDNYSINTSEIKNGYYYLQLNNENNKFTNKIIIQH